MVSLVRSRVDLADGVRLREGEDIVVALDVTVVVGEALSAEGGLVELALLQKVENRSQFMQRRDSATQWVGAPIARENDPRMGQARQNAVCHGGRGGGVVYA